MMDGQTYKYQYVTQSETRVSGSSPSNTTLTMTASLAINVLTACEMELLVSRPSFVFCFFLYFIYNYCSTLNTTCCIHSFKYCSSFYSFILSMESRIYILIWCVCNRWRVCEWRPAGVTAEHSRRQSMTLLLLLLSQRTHSGVTS